MGWFSCTRISLSSSFSVLNLSVFSPPTTEWHVCTSFHHKVIFRPSNKRDSHSLLAVQQQCTSMDGNSWHFCHEMSQQPWHLVHTFMFLSWWDLCCERVSTVMALLGVSYWKKRLLRVFFHPVQKLLSYLMAWKPKTWFVLQIRALLLLNYAADCHTCFCHVYHGS